jgi:Family of unknown function (DUF6074)
MAAERRGRFSFVQILRFPATKRTDFITRQTRYASELRQESGEAHIRRQLEAQRQVMSRRGIALGLIEREVRALEGAIRAAMWRQIFGWSAS